MSPHNKNYSRTPTLLFSIKSIKTLFITSPYIEKTAMQTAPAGSNSNLRVNVQNESAQPYKRIVQNEKKICQYAPWWSASPLLMASSIPHIWRPHPKRRSCIQGFLCQRRKAVSADDIYPYGYSRQNAINGAPTPAWTTVHALWFRSPQ